MPLTDRDDAVEVLAAQREHAWRPDQHVFDVRTRHWNIVDERPAMADESAKRSRLAWRPKRSRASHVLRSV